MNKVFRYEFNKLQFDRANAIASRVEKFSEEVKKIYESIEAFKTLMNEFFSPSQKSVFVDVNGLSVNIANVGPRDLTSLSSGEQQLVVLLTQLWFNPSAISSNILIIDEPELSLHLRWQEMFVSALLTAHSGLQLILATHSPSIILDRDDKAKELVPQYA
jgi:predicted ATP-binding protein involved in virulence